MTWTIKEVWARIWPKNKKVFYKYTEGDYEEAMLDAGETRIFKKE